MSDLRSRKPTANIYIENAVIKYDEEAEDARFKKKINEWANKFMQSYEKRKLLSESSISNAAGSSSDLPNGTGHKTSENANAILADANILNANAAGVNVSANANAKIAHANILNANATGANASVNANARLVNANLANANATGINTSVSTSATGANFSAGNVNATGASASVHTNLTGLEVAAGNLNITGCEVTAGASATACRFSAGNVNVKGAGAAANASVTGTGVSCFNVSVSGPRAGASLNVSGEVQFGNVDIGFTPSLNISAGFNIGIPFFGSGGGGSSSGGGDNNGNNDGSSNGGGGDNNGNNGGSSNGGGGDNNGNNDGSSNGGSGQPNGNGNGGKDLNNNFLQHMQEKYPNRSYVYGANGLQEKNIHRNDGNTVNIKKNTDETPIDVDKIPRVPVCGTDGGNDEGCNHNAASATSENENPKLNGYSYIGFRGTSSEHNKDMPTYRSQNDKPSFFNDKDTWSGDYTTTDPNIAAGYTIADDGKTQPIVQAYTKADIYYTRTQAMDTPEAKVMVTELQRETNNNYSLGGAQSSDMTDPELRAPEFVTRSQYPLVTTPSVHKANDFARLESYHQAELDANRVVPDYWISVDRSTFNAADAVDSTVRHDRELGNAIENGIRNRRKYALIQTLIEKGVDKKDLKLSRIEDNEDNDQDDDEKNLLKAIDLSLSSTKSSNAVQDNYDEEEMFLKALEMSLNTNTESESENPAENNLTQSENTGVNKASKSEQAESRSDEDDGKEDSNSNCNHDKSFTGFCCLKGKSSSKIKKLSGNVFGFDN